MDTSDYIYSFKKKFSLADVLGWVEKACQLRPVVIGEAIIDEYIFCSAIGKSSKDPVLAVLQSSIESYAGGALAVANHLAGLCPDVRLVTQLGSYDRREDFIRKMLRANVSSKFLTQYNAPTIHKRRVVDSYSGAKLIEMYIMDDRAPGCPTEDAVREAISGADLVLAADFGHGFMSGRVINHLWALGVFLAVNAQCNAGNYGFNPVSKYRRADYVCLNSGEIDIETRQRDGDDRQKLLEVTKRIACPRWTVTRGKWGTLHYDLLNDDFYTAPALAQQVVDRVGAGDALFAVTALLSKVGAPVEIVAFCGNVAGACKVEHLGNKEPLTRAALEAHIQDLLKE